MQNGLSNSVKITYLNREKVLIEINDCSLRLKREAPEVLRIFLFGSLIQGNYGPGSDADLLIILDEPQQRLMDLIPPYLKYFSSVSIPVDIIPMTVQEFMRRQKNNDPFVIRILNEAEEIGL